MNFGVGLCLSVLVAVTAGQPMARSPCYDDRNQPQRCIPEFVNAAYNVDIQATNTCGFADTIFCQQTGVTGVTSACDRCDAENDLYSHPARYMTDFHNDEAPTWWQSDTMLESIQYPTSVNLTLPLGKAFEVTYVRLKFHTSRPESFAIYKRTQPGGEWIPWQYYSGSCVTTYNKPNRGYITPDDETVAICTYEFSDISPLTGGNVAFSTLEGRPSAYNFDDNPQLQQWVTATDILVTLNRLNTFGDEVFGDPSVLRSYYYAITDFAVGGRCKCNGHASECVVSNGPSEQRLVCQCMHNTAGPDCQTCQEFYFDVPWQRATSDNTNECQPCNCNGFSNTCYFDQALYDATGHGGYCKECRGNRAGPNCESCRDYYYRQDPTDPCQPCDCNTIGSQTAQCDSFGRCACKPGVTGDKCDRCAPDYFEFSNAGCRQCDCLDAGSLNNIGECRPDTGICTCKQEVEGFNCDRCKPGYFNLQLSNPFGCAACFCYGHSSICTSSTQYQETPIQHGFDSDAEGWLVEDALGQSETTVWDSFSQSLAAQSPGAYPVYYMAPDSLLGDQRLSYNQQLSFTLRTDASPEDARLSAQDLILEGAGLTIYAPITAQGNPTPSFNPQRYSFMLNEDLSLGWGQQLSPFEFQRLLTQLTAIKIRATYSDNGRGFLDDFRLESAQWAGAGAGSVDWVEECVCPPEYAGQFCETCAPGHHRDRPDLAGYSLCVPCQCNGHSATCHLDTGACQCEDNTAGVNCQACQPGYYGDATQGTPADCQPCPCPGGSPCALTADGQVVCTDCPDGYAGNRCDLCADGYFGDPATGSACLPCFCNDNVDLNAVGNCHRITGDCLKCIYNTAGRLCDLCQQGFYGSALTLPKGQCKACGCHPEGSRGTECQEESGQCQCWPNVEGRDCGQCTYGFWDIKEGGCDPCQCDPVGSLDADCDDASGQCQCRPGVTGQRCDRCLDNYYGFSAQGCRPCDCDPVGSLQLQCGADGACPCKPGVTGRHCDGCMENYYDLSRGCVECPPCYGLVQDAVDAHRQKLEELQSLIENIGENPDVVSDADFDKHLAEVTRSVDHLLNLTRAAASGDGQLYSKLAAVEGSVGELQAQLARVAANLNGSRGSLEAGRDLLTSTGLLVQRAQATLKAAEEYLEGEAEEALSQALGAVEDLGEQQEEMEQLAKQALEENKRIQAEANQVEDTAQAALDTSQRALQLVENATALMDQMEARIQQLQEQQGGLDQLAQEASRAAQEALQEARQVLDNATAISADALQPLAMVDPSPLLNNASAILSEANRIKEAAQKLMEDNADLMNDLQDNYREALQLLDQGRQAQGNVEFLLARADAAKDIAEKAFQKGEDLVTEAQQILDNLREYNTLVAESKRQAEEALGRIPQIEAVIVEANQTASRAQQDVAAAKDGAEEARDVAQQAQDTAAQASQGAGQVKEDSGKALAEATKLEERMGELDGEVMSTMERLNGLDQKADEDGALIVEAQGKVNTAGKAADDASNQVDLALDDVHRILEDLAKLEPVEVERLGQLQEEYQQAEQEVAGADLDGALNTLKEARRQQDAWIDQYSGSLEALRREVENIRAINASLPNKCFNSAVELEPQVPK